MPNNDVVDIVIGKKAFEEVARLDKDFVGLIERMKELIETGQQFGKGGIGGGSSTGSNSPRKQLTELEKLNKAYLDTQKKISVSETEIAKKLAASREQLRQKNVETKRAAILSNEQTGAYKRLSTTLNKLRAEYKDVAAAQGVNSREARKLAKQLKSLDNNLKRIDASAGQFGRNVGNYTSAFKGFTRSLRSLVGAFGFTSGIYLFANAVRDSFNRVREFDKAMQNIAGIMRVSRKDISDLEREITKVAGSSIKTSNEVAELAENLVTLGKTKEEIKDLLKPVNDLAIGLETTSGEAAEFLVQMLNTFGASTDEAGKYADVIATIRTSTSLDFQRMRDSFQYLAPISRVLNKDLAYTGSLIGILSDNGIKAERAGRLLGTAQQKLAGDGKTLNDALEEINNSVSSGATELETLKLASDLLGKQSAALGVVLANNTDIIDTNAEAIRNNAGALEDLTKQQLESLDAKLKILDSTWESFIFGIENGTGPISEFFKEAIDGATGFLKILNKLNESQDDVNANAIDRGKESGKKFIDETIKNQNELGKIAGVSASDTNSFINESVEKKRKSSVKEMAVLYQKQQAILKLRNEAQDKFNKLEQESSLLNPLSRSRAASAKTDLRVYNEELSKTTERYNLMRGQLEAISDFSLGKIIQEEGVAPGENTNSNTGGTTGGSGSGNKIAEQRKKDSLALKKYLLEQEVELNDSIFKNEELTLVSRMASLERFEEAQIELAQITRDAKIAANKDSVDAQKLAELEYTDELIRIESERAKRLESMIVDPNDVLEEQGVSDNIADIGDPLDAFARFFGFDPDEMTTLWEEYVKRMESIGEDANLNGFFNDLTQSSEKAQKQLKETAQEIGRELINTTNAVFDNRIQRVEDDIQRNNDYYATLLDDELLSTEQRDQLEAERDAKNTQLEKKRREEQRKQAIFNKVVALAEIAINTARAISLVTAQAGVAAPLLIPAIVALGAVQAATVIATPIPQFKKGKKKGQGKDGLAMVNDGGRDEIRIKADGSMERFKGRNVITWVNRSDQIIPDADSFENQMQDINTASMVSGINRRHSLLSQKQNNVNHIDTRGLKKEIKDGIKQGFKSATLNPTIINKTDDFKSYIQRKRNW